MKSLLIATLILAAPAASVAKRITDIKQTEAKLNLEGFANCKDCAVAFANPDKLRQDEFDPMGFMRTATAEEAKQKNQPAVE